MRPTAPFWRFSTLTALCLTAQLLLLPAHAQAAEPESIPAFEGNGEQFATATAYTSGPESTGKRKGHPQYGLTFSGTRAQEGQTIAVDPRRIPLGSRVYIHELNQSFIAEDTGAAIRGDRIDLYMEDVAQARRWGVRKVRIHVDPQI